MVDDLFLLNYLEYSFTINNTKSARKPGKEGKKRKVYALLLAVLMLTLPTPIKAYGREWLVPQQRSYQAKFTDTDETWCGTYVQICYESGLIMGKSMTKFAPMEMLTNAQITLISARLLNLLQGGDGGLPAASAEEAWYQPAYAALVANNVLAQPDDNQSNLPSFSDRQADSPCSRESFVEILYLVLNEAKGTLPPLNDVSSLPDVTLDTRLPGILSFYNAGILNGKDGYGTFAGNASLNRGEASAMLARIVDPGQRLTFALQSFDLCRDVLELPPETVLLYVDGEPITAEVFGNQLITSLIQWGSNRTENAKKDAVRIWTVYSQSYFTLAKSKKINLNAQQLSSARESAKETVGYFGNSEAFALRLQEQIGLDSLLNAYYQEQYGDKAALLNYNNDLASTAKSIQIKPASALNALDLNAVLTRAIKSPFAYLV